jgi:hypothetical protein
MGDSNAWRSSVVDKVLHHPAPRHEPEVEEARDSHQNARAHSREAVMLDVKLADGSIESFPYAWLARIKYQPGDTLTLRFGRNEINIEGRNLSRTRDLVSEHRARFIQEGTEGEEGLKPEDAPHIERIAIKEGVEEV